MDYKEKVIALLKSQELSKEQKEKLEEIFPELKESENERIRRQTLKVLNYYKDEEKSEGRMPTEIDECIAWLEKQGEQKPTDKVEPKFKVGDTITDPTDSTFTFHINAIKDGKYMESDKDWVLIKEADSDYELVEQKPAWSEEDEMMLEGTIDKISDLGTGEMCKDWLKSLKDRVQPQPKQEWSEEDENHVKSILSTIECCKAPFPNAQAVVEAYNADIEWLKSIRPQNRWKPSDEQIEALHDAIIYVKDSMFPSKNVLKKLYGQLKKLREA